MRTINKKTMNLLDEKLELLKSLCEDQGDFKNELEEAVLEFIEEFKDSKGKTHKQYVEQINETVELIVDQARDVEERLDTYIDNRQHKWRDSERGMQVIEWKENWQDFSRNVEYALMAEDVSLSLKVGSSKGIDSFLELPSDNVYEIVTSYSRW